MILYGDDYDPAMRYEGLARAVFKCGKWKDPWGYAAQDCFTQFVPSMSLEGKRALSTIIIKIILDFPEIEEKNDLKKLEDTVWDSNSQDQAIDIIDKTIEIYNSVLDRNQF